eukprot:8492028-Ditylum_brightwellii.AAC.2
MGSSNEEDRGEYEGFEEVGKDGDYNTPQELLGPNKAQTIPTLLLKKKMVIKLESEDISKYEDLTDMSAFKPWPFKKTKAVAKKKKIDKKPNEVKKDEKVMSVASSVSTDDTKMLITKAKKMLKVDEAKGRQEGLERAADFHCVHGVQGNRKSMQRA